MTERVDLAEWRAARTLDRTAGWLQFGLTAWWGTVALWYLQHCQNEELISVGGGKGPNLGPFFCAVLMFASVLVMAVDSLAVVFADRVGRKWCVTMQTVAVAWGLIQAARIHVNGFRLSWGVVGDPPGRVTALLSGWPNVVGGMAVLALVVIAQERGALRRSM